MQLYIIQFHLLILSIAYSLASINSTPEYSVYVLVLCTLLVVVDCGCLASVAGASPPPLLASSFCRHITSSSLLLLCLFLSLSLSSSFFLFSCYRLLLCYSGFFLEKNPFSNSLPPPVSLTIPSARLRSTPPSRIILSLRWWRKDEAHFQG